MLISSIPDCSAACGGLPWRDTGGGRPGGGVSLSCVEAAAVVPLLQRVSEPIHSTDACPAMRCSRVQAAPMTISTLPVLQFLSTRGGRISGPWGLHHAHMVLPGETGAWAVPRCDCRPTRETLASGGTPRAAVTLFCHCSQVPAVLEGKSKAAPQLYASSLEVGLWCRAVRANGGLHALAKDACAGEQRRRRCTSVVSVLSAAHALARRPSRCAARRSASPQPRARVACRSAV